MKTSTQTMPHDHGDISFVLQTMPDRDICTQTAERFKQLSDGTRLQIFWLLCHSEECVLNIAAAIDMSPPAVSHHLRCLKQAGLISGRRVGKEVRYSLAGTEEAQLLHHIVDKLLKSICPKGVHNHEHTK